MNDSQHEALEELRQRGYDGIADEIAQGLQKWDNWFASYNASVLEDYLQGHTGMHVHILARVARSAGPLHEYCVHIENNVAGDDGIVNSSNILVAPNCHSDTFDAVFNGPRGTGRKRAVLVDSIQLMNLPEWMRLICVSSVVRLECINGDLRCGVNATDFLGGGLGVANTIAKDWKFGSRLLFFGPSGGKRLGKCERQMVQCGSKIKNTFSDQDIQPDGACRDAINSQSPDLNSIADGLRQGLRVWFINDSVGFSIDPGSGVYLERIEVFARPLKFKNEAVVCAHVLAVSC
ncbi:MAG: hypothetical protein K8T25_02025 [Planctomycetia bacterium]|nr:hypothetical protein [Planctomycetia bacterium]